MSRDAPPEDRIEPVDSVRAGVGAKLLAQDGVSPDALGTDSSELGGLWRLRHQARSSALSVRLDRSQPLEVRRRTRGHRRFLDRSTQGDAGDINAPKTGVKYGEP